MKFTYGKQIGPGLCRVQFLAILTASGFCGSAAAQHAEQPTVRLPPVVVTATNDSEQEILQQLPIAVTPLPSVQLDRGVISSTLDLGRAVPNFSPSDGGMRSFSDTYIVRGLGNTEFFSEPAVVVYVDDAPFSDVISYTTELLAIDHIDIYRGPQGTRFGKNSEAGVINIVTRQPRDRFEAEASASTASFDTQKYRASVFGPIAKGKLYFGLAGQYATSDGSIRNSFLDSEADEYEVVNGRSSVSWKPSQDWDVRFTATVDKFDGRPRLASLNTDPRRTTSDFDGEVKTDANSQSLRVGGALPDIAVTSITTRRDFQLDPFKFDPDFSPIPGNVGIARNAQVQWSEELRLRPLAPNDRWEWQGGFFFSTTEVDGHRTVEFVIPPIGLAGRDDIDFTQGLETYALFGECTHTPWQKFHITLGLRLDYSLRDLRRTRTSTFGSPPPIRADADFFNVAPKLTLAYDVTDALLIYGSTGVGFKPGGFSPIMDPPFSPHFDTERAWANEIGLKSSWLNGIVTANIALFYSDVSDYQVEQFTPVGLDFTVVNAPRATSLGAELEVAVHPAKGWEFSGFFGYTDARIERYSDPFTGATVRDTHPPFVAEFNGGLSAQYKHKRGPFARLEYVAVGEKFHEVANTSRFKQSAYGLLNARVGYEREHFGVFVFGENLTDTEYFTKKFPSTNSGAPGWPRSIGVMVVARY